jgi:hypothetical protein
MGRTPHFAEIALDEPVAAGRLVTASVTGHALGRLTGTTLS